MPVVLYAPGIGRAAQAPARATNAAPGGVRVPPPAFAPSAWLRGAQQQARERAHAFLEQQRDQLGRQIQQRGQQLLNRVPAGVGALAPALGGLYYGAQALAPVINRAVGIRTGFIGGQVRRGVGAETYDAHVAAGGRPSDFLRWRP